MKIAVVSNMYPDEKHPSYGVFVKNFCNILDSLKIVHKDCVMLKSDSKIGKALGYVKFYVGTTVYLLFGTYDLVYVHYASHSSIPVLFANRFRKKPVYTNVHGSDAVPENTKQLKMQKYTKKILSISDKVVIPSEYFKELVANKYGVENRKLYVSPSGGVNNKVFYQEKEKECNDVLKIGYVGRISHKKGWDTLIRACSKVTVPYKLLVVGNGPEYDGMKRMAVELGVDVKTTWLDLQSQDKLRAIYNDIDVFIFPTERAGESLGLVALEAMMCGTPVIASDFAAPKYYIDNGVNGFKYKCGDADGLKKCIEAYYVLDKEKRRYFSINAKKAAAAFDVENVKENMKALLRGDI